jgi:hypothetical protein
VKLFCDDTAGFYQQNPGPVLGHLEVLRIGDRQVRTRLLRDDVRRDSNR